MKPLHNEGVCIRSSKYFLNEFLVVESTCQAACLADNTPQNMLTCLAGGFYAFKSNHGCMLYILNKQVILMGFAIFQFKICSAYCAGAVLGQVSRVPVNPWISRTYSKKPFLIRDESDSGIGENPWIETPNVTPAVIS